MGGYEKGRNQLQAPAQMTPVTDLFPYMGSAGEIFEGELLGANIMKWKVVRRYIKSKPTTKEILFIPFKSDDFGSISSHG